MKIGILTFSAAINYGAVLQAYALKSTLEHMGHDVHVIDYSPNYLTECYRIFTSRPGFRTLITLDGIKKWSNYIFRITRRRWLRAKRFNSFKRRFLSLDKKPIVDLSSTYDVLVCGSDQIWGKHITHEFDPVFFGQYPEGKTNRVIAYAGSFGSPKRIEGHERLLVNMLKSFDAISAREQNLTDFIRKESKNTLECTTVLDPTLISPREAFFKLSEKRYVRNPYMLYFDLFNDSELRSRAHRIAEGNRLQFIEVSTYHDSVPHGNLYSPVGPDGFLSLVRHADMVITTSFHCTVFSIIFERNFYTFEFDEKFNDRIVNLLDKTNLLGRFVYRSTIDLSEGSIDYDSVNSRLEIERQHSLQWLEHNLRS